MLSQTSKFATFSLSLFKLIVRFLAVLLAFVFNKLIALLFRSSCFISSIYTLPQRGVCAIVDLRRLLKQTLCHRQQQQYRTGPCSLLEPFVDLGIRLNIDCYCIPAYEAFFILFCCYRLWRSLILARVCFCNSIERSENLPLSRFASNVLFSHRKYTFSNRLTDRSPQRGSPLFNHH